MNEPRKWSLDALRREPAPIRISREDLVEVSEPSTGDTLPVVVQARRTDIDLAAWARANRPFIERRLLQNGAVLFRKFGVMTIEQFDECAAAVIDRRLKYRYRASPRTSVGNNIYTSTDYPSQFPIFPHNEHGYSPVFPLRLAFGCLQPPVAGGQTPIGDIRQIAARIPKNIKDRFLRMGIMYVRNFSPGLGVPWEISFDTSDKGEVERYCREHDISCEWLSDGRLRTCRVGPAFVQHPLLKESIWFNHAAFYHHSSLVDSVREDLYKLCPVDEWPNNTYYGDGTPIEAEVAESLRAAYEQEMKVFDWMRGDVLVMDNMLAVHARAAYTGDRRIVVAMGDEVNAEPFRRIK